MIAKNKLFNARISPLEGNMAVVFYNLLHVVHQEDPFDYLQKLCPLLNFLKLHGHY
jgi:hypothetical protein